MTKKENALNAGEIDREEWRNELRVPENVPNFCGKAIPPSLKNVFFIDYTFAVALRQQDLKNQVDKFRSFCLLVKNYLLAGKTFFKHYFSLVEKNPLDYATCWLG